MVFAPFALALWSCAPATTRPPTEPQSVSVPSVPPDLGVPDAPAHIELWDGSLQLVFRRRSAGSWRDQEGRRCSEESLEQWLDALRDADLEPVDRPEVPSTKELRIVGTSDSTWMRHGADVLATDVAAFRLAIPELPECATDNALGIRNTTRSIRLRANGRSLEATRTLGGWVDADGQGAALLVEAITGLAHLPRITAQVVDDDEWGSIVVTHDAGVDTFALGPRGSHGPDHWVLHRETQTVFRLSADALATLVGDSAAVGPPDRLGGLRCALSYAPEQREPPMFERWLTALDGGELIGMGCGQTHPMIGRTEMKLRWEGPGGLATLSDAGGTSYHHPVVEQLPPNELVWSTSKGGEAYAGGAYTERYRFAWDQATHRFRDAAPPLRLDGDAWHEARIAAAVEREDWTLALADTRAQLDFHSEDRMRILAKFLHPHVLRLHREDRDRDAADLVLALLGVREGTRELTVEPRRVEWAVKFRSLEVDFGEIFNDYGFVLDEGGEPLAAAQVL
ncbi:MAG: hypothetical protein AAF211_20030, partial [Myxococcota bacterium]